MSAKIYNYFNFYSIFLGGGGKIVTFASVSPTVNCRYSRMKHFFQTLLLSSALGTCIFCADAKPARPGLMTMTQPDGSTIEVRLVGDEFYHYYLSEDGYLLLEKHDGFYYGGVDAAGKIVDSGIRASSPAQRGREAREFLMDMDMPRLEKALDMEAAAVSSARHKALGRTRSARAQEEASGEGFQRGPGLFPGSAFPSVGNQKAIVILVEYADVKFELDDPHDYFYRMLNEPDFSDYGGTGSAKEYFEECSDNLFRPDFDLYGPVTLSRAMKYYGGNVGGSDAHPEEMVIEACNLLDDTVDFSQYDRDGDGFIDNVFLFYAGRGEATGGGADTVWPHSWGITTSQPTKKYVYDGVQLDHYACSNEWEGERPDGVGTFVHEFSHVMGLPDLYTTAYTNAFTPGKWSALDYGPYNNDGRTPPLYGAFERYALGWLAPAEIKEPLNATLPAIGNNIAGIIKTEKEYEFFLLENRQQTSWDKYIPGHGMLVWHVDYNISVWSENRVNNPQNHQYVDIEEADNIKTEATRDGDPFPGTAGITSFTDNTTPSMKTWAGKNLDLPITEIAETPDGIITFKVKGGAEPISSTTALPAGDVTDIGFTARWETVPGLEYLLNVYTRDEDTGEVAYLPGYRMRNMGNAAEAEVPDLEAETEYFYTVHAAKGLEVAPESNEINAYTGEPTIRRLRVQPTEPEEITGESFMATWLPLEDAVDYEITVFTKTYDAPLVAMCDFANGSKDIKGGWSSSSTSTFANGSYSGQAIPSLRLANADHFTATFPDEIRSVSFWHRGSSTSEGDMIQVYATTPDGRALIRSVPVVADKGGTTTSITDIPAGTESVRLEFLRTGAKGSLAIDDVTVEHGYTYAPVVLEGYDAVATGNVTAFPVTGLQPETDYYYTLRATDGERFSKLSSEMRATTGKRSSMERPVAPEGISVSCTGLRLRISASEDAVVAVVDLPGRTVAVLTGTCEFTLPGAGVYMVGSGNYRTKIFAR